MKYFYFVCFISAHDILCKARFTRFFVFKIYPANCIAQDPSGSLYFYKYKLEQRLFSLVKHTVVDNSFLNLFKVMLIERKIWYEDEINNVYQYIRIYYERSKPPTCRPKCFGHSYGNPEGGVTQRMYYYKYFKNQCTNIKH